MTLFSVVCPTCGAKLPVQSADRVGDVELCPSCRSMVLIEPPRGAASQAPAPPAERAGDAEEATEAGSLSNSFEEGVTDTVDVARAEATEAARVRGGRSRFLVDEAVPPPVSDPGIAAASRHDSPPTGYPLHPGYPGEATSLGPEPRRLQHALTLAAATVTGIGVAAILFVIVVVATRTRPDPLAASGDDLAVVPSGTEPKIEEGPTPDGGGGGERAADPDGAGDSDSEDLGGDDPATAAPAGDPASDPPTPPVEASDPPADPPGVGAEEDPSVAPMPAETPDDADDPAPPAPSEGDAPPIFGDADPSTPEPVEAASEAADLAELLERIAPGSSTDPFAASDPAAEAARRAQAEDLATLRAVMTELVNQGGGDTAERPPLLEVDVEERLAENVIRVHATDLSVDAFLHQVGAFSAIPMQWDPDVRRWARSRGVEKVTVRLDEATDVRGLLDAGLGPLGLGAVPRDGYVEILIGAKPLELRDVVIPWDQIPIPEAMRAEFAERIRLWIDPVGWTDDPAGRTIAATDDGLKIRQIETELFKIDLFVDRLRLALGEDPVRGTPDELLDPRPAHLRAKEILEKPAALVELRPVPLSQGLFDLSQSSGLTIVADWNSLLAAGWGPMSETTFSAPTAPLRETLAASLRRLGLGYRTVDDSTVQVLSPEALALGVEIEIYRVDESLIDGDATKFAEGLASELNAALGEGFDAARGLWISPGDRLLVAALPRPAQVWLSRRLNPAAKTASR